MSTHLTAGLADLRRQLNVVDKVLSRTPITDIDRDRLEGLDNFLSELIATLKEDGIAVIEVFTA